MRDKDYSLMLNEYCSVARHIICTQPSTERAASAECLAGEIEFCQPTVYSDVAGARRVALQRPEQVVCVTGSFFTVGEALTSIRGL